MKEKEKEKLKTIVDKHLINKKGRLEGQRINEKWFLKRALKDEYNMLLKYSINNTQSLYNVINETSSACECGKTRRFCGYTAGYKKYCESCSRTKFNSMKIHSNKDIEYVPDDNFSKRKSLSIILTKYKDCRNNYSTSKLLSNRAVISDIYSTTYYNEQGSIAERIYHIMNNITSSVICKECGSVNDSFISNNEGYRSVYCIKNGCNRKHTKRTGPSDTMILNAYNKRKSFYDDINAGLCVSEYKVKFPSFDEFALKRVNAEVEFKHLKCGKNYKRFVSYQGALHCPACNNQKSKLENDIYSYISSIVTAKQGDRKLLDNNKEIDILSSMFGVEVNGQMYHSYGKNNVYRFNNYTHEDKYCHLYKTKEAECKGIQLFQIFSSEWYNKTNIWKSVLNSRMNKTSKIYARKCEIREVDSKVSKEFCTDNHLQGYTRARVRIGLFYDNNLVQLMTLSSSRYIKEIEYELIRLCSKLNTTVVGGASKLLKYFERVYKPKSIISYANRRWSQGNVYEKLGFEFSHNTSPNYFYIRGNGFDTADLESRLKYQKHKLKYMIDKYNPTETETVNMYNNNYRKIYDCGNKVYIKRYDRTL